MKLSVSIITYNHQNYIEEAIESALKQQTNFDYEIVVSDDCSTDKTAEIVEKIAATTTKITFIKRTQNVGMVRNALETISMCKGEYIALLEGDDFWIDTYKLQKQVDLLDQYPEVVSCCTNGVSFVDRFYDKRQKFYDTKLKPPALFDLDYLVNSNVFIHSNTRVFRKSVHPTVFPNGLFEASNWDWALSLIHAQKGSVAYIDDVTFAYRRHENALINFKNYKKTFKSGLVLLDGLNKYFDYKYDKVFSQKYWHFQELSFLYLKDRNVLLFLFYILKSLFNKPIRTKKEYKDIAWAIMDSIFKR